MAEAITPSLACPEKSRSAYWRRRLSLAVMLSGTFMTIMDVFIVNVAIPSIRRDLTASFAQVELIVAGYGLTYAVMLITAGRLGDIFGRRRMFMIGLASFTAASALCGLAPTSGLLVAARLLQGLAAAILFPQVFSLIRVTFSDAQERAAAFSLMGVAIGIACIAGQLLGGLIVEADFWGLAWRPVFLINVPIGLAAFAAAPLVIEESRSPEGRRIDAAGILLSALGLGLLLYPLIEGREQGWPLWSLLMLGASLPVLAIFGFHQHAKSRRKASPLLETSLFRDRAFAFGVLIVLIFYSTLNSTYLSFALLVQIGLGRNSLDAGLILAANALTFMLSSIAAGWLRPERRRIALAGGGAICVLANLSMVATATWRMPLDAEAFVPALIIWGIGEGLVMTPLFNAILTGVDERHVGSASGMLSTMQQVGGAFGVAAVGILFFAALDHARLLGLSGAAAYADAFIAASLYGAVAAAITCALLFILPKAQPVHVPAQRVR